MTDGDREYIGGWLVVENHDFAWNQGVSDPDVKIIVCGEIGHVRWLLFQVAWREAVFRDLELLLQDFAERVGIEYRPPQRRRQPTPNNPSNVTATEETS